MPFSYVGCTNTASVAGVSGNLAGTGLSGNFNGATDGVAVAGSFTGSFDAASGTYAGTYANSAGKLPVRVGTCAYDVAAFGTFKLFPLEGGEPAAFTLSATSGTSPTFSWPAVAGAVAYTVRVFDATCVAGSITSAACYRGEAIVFTTSVAYPAQFFRSTALAAGSAYVVTLAAQDASGRVVGFRGTRLQR